MSYIASSVNQNLVLGVCSFDDKIRLEPKQAENPNQLWDFNEETIRNKGNGKVMDISGGGGSGTSVITYPYHGGSNQRWINHADGTIESRQGGNLVLDIWGNNIAKGAELIVFSRHGAPNQVFHLK